MKKTCLFILITLGLQLTLPSDSNGQTAAAVQKKIEQTNKQFLKWFNNAKPDSIVSLYHPNACMTDRGCGKDFLLKYYQTETSKYTMKELTTLSVTVKDNVATETGQWKILLPNGVELVGKYSSEWQRVNNRWVIFKETVLE